MGQHHHLDHSWKPDLFSLITVTDIYRVISLCHVGLSALHVFSKVCLRAQPLGDPSSHPESWASLLCCLQQVIVLVRAPVFHLINGPNIPCPTLKGFNEWLHGVLRGGYHCILLCVPPEAPWGKVLSASGLFNAQSCSLVCNISPLRSLFRHFFPWLLPPMMF